MKKILLSSLLTFCIASLGLAQTTFSAKNTINSATGDAPFTIDSGLIDNDALIDIIIGTNNGNTIEWYKNNGDGTFTIQTLVANTLSALGGLKLVDLNNDTFLDILATAYTNDIVAWYANDGLGNFGAEQIISNTVLGASGIAVGTIDAGSTIDVAVTAYDSGMVVWFSNDGSGNFTGPNTLDNTLAGPGSVNLKDIDNDGDLDALITTAQFAGAIDTAEIFRNNGSGVFTKDATSVTTGKNYIFNATFEDLDGDANLDILLTELNVTAGTGNFYWIEEDGLGGYTETTFTTSVGNPSVAQHRDLDDDGDKDIILSSGMAGAGNDIVWFINDGTGSYGSEVVIDATQSQAYVFTANDFDNDGDLDIASCAFNQDSLNWFENLRYTLNISEIEENNINIYPNPVDDNLYFNGINFNNNSAISIYNVLGKKILEATINNDKPIDVSNLTSGLYFIKFNTLSKTFKILKK